MNKILITRMHVIYFVNGFCDVGDHRELSSVIRTLNIVFFPLVTKQRDPDTGQHSLLFQVRILK